MKRRTSRSVIAYSIAVAVASLVSFVCGCSVRKQTANAIEKPKKAQAESALDVTDKSIYVSPEERGTASSKDYESILRKAAGKNEAALKELFMISANSPWDGAGAAFHFHNMRRVLFAWGDTDFARVLRTQPPGIRKAVAAALNWPDKGLENRFPLTNAAAHKD